MDSRIYSRREAIRGLAALALAPALPGGAAASESGDGGFRFVVVNDLHYRDGRCELWFEQVVASIKALRPAPAFCLLNGDLSEAGTPGQLAAVRRSFFRLPMPVRTAIGNHDCLEDGNRAGYEKLYGARVNYGFEHGGWKFLTLDTTQGPDVYRTRISAGTFGWVEQTLPRVDRQQPLVVFSHFPLGRNWLRPLNATTLLTRFQHHNLRAVLSGHWHGITERAERGAALSTARCCSWWRTNHDGSALRGYTLCQTRDGAISHQFIPVAIPAALLV